MAQQAKTEVEKLIEQNSTKTIILSYLMTILFGVVCAVACMAGREMIETSLFKIIYSSELGSVVQYGGYRRLTQIGAIVAMAITWLCTFMVIWHKIETGESLKSRLITCGKACAVAIAAYLVFGIIMLAVVGYWPTLSGSV